MRKLFLIYLLLLSLALSGQQSQQLFRMHYLGQSNFMNPAVQSDCKIFIGIPVLSSIHLNAANSVASYRQLVKHTSDSTASLNVDKVIDRLGWRSTVATEVQVAILALGYKYKDYYFAFSIIEKNDIPMTLSKDLFRLAWKGNTQFEGEHARAKGSALYATHYREYALGVSKKTGYKSYLGLKGKLLFGKLNASTPRTNVSLYTDPNTFDLTLEGNIKANVSGPISFDPGNGYLGSIELIEEDIDIRELIFNRKNWGIAFDAGFIRRVNDQVSVSASVLDLGFIRWRSGVSNLSSEENFTYQGVLVDSGNMIASIADSIQVTITENPYIAMLPLRLHAGLDYRLNESLTAWTVGSAVAYRTKIAPKLSFGLDYNPFRNFHLVASYSLMYRAFNNFGFGFSLGRGPVQFYAISDNAAGMIWPLSTRNINLRFGLNLNFGCRAQEQVPESVQKSTGGRCDCYLDPWERQKKGTKRRR